MRTWELDLPSEIDVARLERIVEEWAAERGLRVTRKGALAAYPGCRHWHLKREGEPGTLEVTAWPSQRRLWLAVHANRSSAWIDTEIEALLGTLAQALLQP